MSGLLDIGIIHTAYSDATGVCTGVRILNNVLEGNPNVTRRDAAATRAAIYMGGSGLRHRNVLIANNTIRNFRSVPDNTADIGVYILVAGSTSWLGNCVVSGNIVENCGKGIVI